MSLTRIRLSCGLVLVMALGVVGCESLMNVPPEGQDSALNNPNQYNVSHAMNAAIKWLLADRPASEPFYVVLPEGCDQATYARVLAGLDDQAVSGLGQRIDGPVLQVLSVRVRGYNAEVDLVRYLSPKLDGPRGRFITVYLRRRAFENWTLDRITPWLAVPAQPPSMVP
ncbi:MAG: hypothetical protein IT443_09945 [Phycisphaeraceae bacterium]|nr:hypothetical protein [Phycisphaeraceae bacterium]